MLSYCDLTRRQNMTSKGLNQMLQVGFEPEYPFGIGVGENRLWILRTLDRLYHKVRRRSSKSRIVLYKYESFSDSRNI